MDQHTFKSPTAAEWKRRSRSILKQRLSDDQLEERRQKEQDRLRVAMRECRLRAKFSMTPEEWELHKSLKLNE